MATLVRVVIYENMTNRIPLNYVITTAIFCKNVFEKSYHKEKIKDTLMACTLFIYNIQGYHDQIKEIFFNYHNHDNGS